MLSYRPRLTFFSHPDFEAFPQTAVSTLIALILVHDAVSRKSVGTAMRKNEF